MNYRKTKGKWVINKNGVFIALTDSEVDQLAELIADIKSGAGKLYAEDARKPDSEGASHD